MHDVTTQMTTRAAATTALAPDEMRSLTGGTDDCGNIPLYAGYAAGWILRRYLNIMSGELLPDYSGSITFDWRNK